MLSKDIRNVLEFYNIGSLISYRSLRRLGDVQKVFIVRTTKGSFFLKEYDSLTQSVVDGFRVIKYLSRRKYPCVKVIYTRERRPYVKVDDNFFAIFEFLEGSNKHQTNRRLSPKMFYELGKYLGRLHRLTKGLNIKSKERQDLNYLRGLLRKNRCKIKKAPKKVRGIYDYIDKELNLLKIPKSLPRAVLHNEFTFEHVWFKDQKVFKVIDWDLVTRDFCFFDLATSLVSCFRFNKIDFEVLGSLIKGYTRERRLNPWERDHIFEMLQFGAFKFALWNLDAALSWNYKIKHFHQDYSRVEVLMHYDREKFNKEKRLRKP